MAAVRRTRWRAAASLSVALSIAVLTGCGSTLQATGSDSSLNANSDLVAPGGSVGAGGAPAAAGGSSATGGGSSAAGGSLTGGGGGGSSSGAGAGPLANVRLRNSVRVGIVYLKGLEAAYRAAGASSATTDAHADYQAVIAHLNATRGTGPKLIAYYYAINSSSSQSASVQFQAACAHFINDQPVDIVLTYTIGSDQVLPECLSQHHIPLVNGSPEAGAGAAAFSKRPLYWEPSQISLDRLGRLLPSFLVSHRWADTRWAAGPKCPAVRQPRIGVVTFDRPDWRTAYVSATAPTFKSLGQPVYDVVFLSVSGNTAQQLADASAGVQSAVLKFSSECVDHVAFVLNVAADYLFMNVASQQGYHPRYGLSSLEAGPVIIGSLAQAGAQLHGSMGPGWAPYADVAINDFDALAKAPSSACMSILSHAGLTPKDNNAAILALPSCEGPFFVSTIVRQWLASGTSTTLLDVVNRLGNSYHPAGSYAATLGAAKHDGASQYRDFVFVDSCTCFRYTSGLHQI